MCFYQTHIPILSPPTLLLFCPWYSLPISCFLFICFWLSEFISAINVYMGIELRTGVSWIEVICPFPEVRLDLQSCDHINLEWNQARQNPSMERREVHAALPYFLRQSFIKSGIHTLFKLTGQTRRIHLHSHQAGSTARGHILKILKCLV